MLPAVQGGVHGCGAHVLEGVLNAGDSLFENVLMYLILYERGRDDERSRAVPPSSYPKVD